MITRRGCVGFAQVRIEATFINTASKAYKREFKKKTIPCAIDLRPDLNIYIFASLHVALVKFGEITFTQFSAD